MVGNDWRWRLWSAMIDNYWEEDHSLQWRKNSWLTIFDIGWQLWHWLTMVESGWHWLKMAKLLFVCLLNREEDHSLQWRTMVKTCSTGRKITPVGRTICRPRLTAFKEFSLREQKLMTFREDCLDWIALVKYTDQVTWTSGGASWRCGEDSTNSASNLPKPGSIWLKAKHF